MRVGLVAKVRSLLTSDFGRNAGWLIVLSAFERAIALAQTVLIARALGITEYGIYGLLFGTIGFVASIAGLQLGLTVAVHVAMYKGGEKEKTAAVITAANKLGLALSLTFMAITLPLSPQISDLLFDSPEYRLIVSLGTAFVVATIICGIQDGVAQGLEIFRTLAKVKALTMGLSFLVIYPAAKWAGIPGLLVVLLMGLGAKYAILRTSIRIKRMEVGIPPTGKGPPMKSLLGNFALPSMLVSLLTGFVTLVGMLQLSRQAQGFDLVAMVNAGLQWRGPVLLLAASLGGVAVPTFSRLVSNGDKSRVAEFRKSLLVLNGTGSMFAAGLLSLLSVPILRSYGPGFEQGVVAFSLILLSTVPTIIAGVFMQELIGSARMWRQLWIHIPYVAVLMACFYALIPRHGSNGYAFALLAGSMTFMMTAWLVDKYDGQPKEFAPPSQSTP